MNVGYPEVPPHLAKMSKSTKWFRKINGEIATVFTACIAVSAAPNRSYDIMTVIAGLLNAACHAKNITKIARAEREAERQRRGCRCKHKGKCKYACKCKKRCGCKYWRGDCPSHEYFRKALAAATEENAGAAFMEHVEHSMRMLRRARALRRGLLAVGLDKHGILRAARAPGLVFKRVNGVVGWHEIYTAAHVLVDGERLTIAAVAVKKGMGDHEAVRALLAEIQRHAPHLHLVLADKEFCTTQVINEIEAAGLRYLFAHPRNSKAKKGFEALDARGDVGSAARSVMKSKGTREAAEYWLRIEQSNDFKLGKWRPEKGLSAKYVAYATNLPYIDAARYAERWGIETAYRMNEEVRPRTSSRSHGPHVFNFVFCLVLCNVAVVANSVYLHDCGGAYRHATLQTIVKSLHDQACQAAMGMQPHAPAGAQLLQEAQPLRLQPPPCGPPDQIR